MQEDQRSQQRNAAESAVTAAKTGKAVANIAKGAAAGGVHGAVLSTARLWLVPVVAVLILPILIAAMLPSVIFGSFFGDGTDSTSAIVDDTVLTQNIFDLNTGISTVLSEGLVDVLNRIDANFALSSCDIKEINNPYESDVVFNANAIISMYCASKDVDIKSISLDDIKAVLRANQSKLYSFTYIDEERLVEGEIDPQTNEPTEVPATARIYEVQYNGEAYFRDAVFNLSEDQKILAGNYAQNLSVLLGDGMYQVLSDYSSMGASYEGVTFSDGVTQVTYYNQLDSRWCNEPYGTDNIGGYACGPTAMAIVVSSLTSETVDPPHMAQWAYENGYWCSGSGSYHTLIPNAAKAWGLDVEGCSAAEPQRIADALADGKLVVALMTKGHFTSSGHFIVLRGVASDGQVLVADPSSLTRSNMPWDMKIILNEASKRAGAGGPFWIIG